MNLDNSMVLCKISKNKKHRNVTEEVHSLSKKVYSLKLLEKLLESGTFFCTPFYQHTQSLLFLFLDLLYFPTSDRK